MDFFEEHGFDDEIVPNCQIIFPENTQIEKILGKHPQELLENEYFGRVAGVWREERKVETEFYKVELVGETYLAFKFPTLFQEIFIGKYGIRESDKCSYFEIVDIGFFDVGESFHKEKYFIQSAYHTSPNYFGNNTNFFETVWAKFKEIEAFRIGSREVLDQNEKHNLKNENIILREELSNYRYSKEISALENLENTLKIKPQKIIENENRQTEFKEKIQNPLIWKGKNFQDFGIKPEKFSNFAEFEKAILDNLLKDNQLEKEKLSKKLHSELPPENQTFNKTLEPKDEFETEAEFQYRKTEFEVFKTKFELKCKKDRDKQIIQNISQVKSLSFQKPNRSQMLNSYLGTQDIEMKYDAEIGKFSVKVKSRILNFELQIQVPRNIAREFKNEVKSFEFWFSEDFVLENIKVVFLDKKFFGDRFEENILEKIEREKKREREKEISEKTLKVGNLLFQDFNLPQPMNWKSACEYCEKLKLLDFSDWRLPSKYELKMVYHYKPYFNNVEISWYWSITKHNSSLSNSWLVSFNHGYDDYDYQNDSHSVRCIRYI